MRGMSKSSITTATDLHIGFVLLSIILVATGRTTNTAAAAAAAVVAVSVAVRIRMYSTRGVTAAAVERVCS